MTRNTLVAALSATALLAAGGDAQAQTCPAGREVVPNMDPHGAVWEVEGPITSFDLTARTISVMGVPVEFPLDYLIHTGGDKHVTLEQLTDATLEQTRSIIGGTLIAGGALQDPDLDGCYNLIPESAEFLFRENVLVAMLPRNAVEADKGVFWLMGTPIKLNTDPRVPADLLDASGNPDIGFADLAMFEGRIQSPEGYFERDTLRAVVIEADAYKINPAPLDNVIITKSRWLPDKLELRVLGYVEPTGATYVDVFAPGRLAVDPATGAEYCEGTFRARLATFADPDMPTQSRYVYHSGDGVFPTQPDMVCVISEGGDANRGSVVPWRRIKEAAPTDEELEEEEELILLAPAPLIVAGE